MHRGSAREAWGAQQTDLQGRGRQRKDPEGARHLDWQVIWSFIFIKLTVTYTKKMFLKCLFLCIDFKASEDQRIPCQKNAGTAHFKKTKIFVNLHFYFVFSIFENLNKKLNLRRAMNTIKRFKKRKRRTWKFWSPRKHCFTCSRERPSISPRRSKLPIE